jgi:hypothetical protein
MYISPTQEDIMELYKEENAPADIQRIKENLTPHYAERLAKGEIQSYTVKAGYQHMNLFWASVEYLPAGDGERFGPITAHYTILIRNGNIEFQGRGGL